MKRPVRFFIPILPLLLMTLLLAGCGSSAAKSSGAPEQYTSEADASASAEDAGGGTDNTEETDTPDASEGTDGTISEEKLVYTASVTLQTLQYKDSCSSIKQKIKAAGGFIESEQETDSDYAWYDSAASTFRATMRLELTIRIPAEKYNDFLDSLSGDGKILSKSSSVQNITKSYYDTQAVIEGLETQQNRLNEMMAQAETVEDMIAIETRLSEVQVELQQEKRALSSMDTDVRYSTVYLSVTEVSRYSDTSKGITFPERLVSALKGSAEFFLSTLENLLFFLIYALPVALFAVLIFVIIRAIVRKVPKRKAKRRPDIPGKPGNPPHKPWNPFTRQGNTSQNSGDIPQKPENLSQEPGNSPQMPENPPQNLRNPSQSSETPSQNPANPPQDTKNPSE